MEILVTGAAGFIGSNFVRYWSEQYPQDRIVGLDKLTYAGNVDNLADLKDNPNFRFVRGDITDRALIDRLMKKTLAVVHFAAESHNSYAIKNPTAFFYTNVIGTQTLLESARNRGDVRFHHVSTCEVYGDMALESNEAFTETSPLKPRTPYNASKAGSDLAVGAYIDTFKLETTISRCANNYGPYQFPEKVIPAFLTKLVDDQPIPIYKSSQNKREWLHVLDHCRAIDLILRDGKIGETYNIGSGVEKSVEELVEILLRELGKPESLKQYVEDRPGHDRRYLLDSSKITADLGWKPQVDFDEGMKETIDWYLKNPEWWRPLQKRLQIQEQSWR